MASSESVNGDYVVVGMETRPNYCRLQAYTRDCHSSSTCCCTDVKHDLRQEEMASGIASPAEGAPEACAASSPKYRRRVHPTNAGGSCLCNGDITLK